MEPENKTQLSEKEIARAVSNDPALSEVSFELGDRTFKIVDLSYDSYVAFLAELQPLAEAMFGSVMAGSGQSFDGLSPGALLKYCAKSLPEMVRIVCSQTVPDITVDDIKRGSNPFKLAWIVLRQIEQNNMVKDFSDFFGSILPLIKMAMAGQKSE